MRCPRILLALLAAAAGASHAGEAARDPDAPMTEAQARARTHMAAIAAAGGVAVFLYGQHKWWQDGFTGDFRTQDEGWFGRNTYAGGADKLGHAWGNYVATRALARTFEWVGNDRETSLVFAAASVFAGYTAIEVLDGYSKKWRFSREDAAINIAGIGAALALELNPALDSVLDFRLHYRRSPGQAFDPFSDYSGQTYLLVAKASGVPALRRHSLLRYAELAAGYSARGYDDGPVQGRSSRNLYFGVSLNLAELLDETAFRDAERSSWARLATKGVLEVVQVPGTGVYARRRLD